MSHSIAPMLSVRRGAEAVEFYQRALGAHVVFRIEADGELVARLSVHGAEFWVSDESPEHRNFSPESLGGSTARMILTVPDPDTAFARAIDAGGVVVTAVENNYGWRLGRFHETSAHHWEIGHPLDDASSRSSAS